MSRTFRLSGVMALVFALLLPSSVAVSTASEPKLVTSAVAGRHLDSLAQGTLVDENGRATKGTVAVFLNTLGANNTLEPVSVVRTRPNGSFVVPFPRMTSTIKNAAARNGGQANFFLAGGSETAKSAYSFPASVVKGRWGNTGIKSARLVTNTRLSHEEKDAAADSNRQLSVSPNNAPPQIGGICLYNLQKKRNRNTMVAEFHTSHDQRQTITYGAEENADSEISVGVKAGSQFKASGTVHIGNSLSGATDRTVGANYGYSFKTGFTYGKYRLDPISLLHPFCWVVPTAMKLATEWVGGISTGSDLRYKDHNCRNSQFRRSWGPGDGFTRDNKNLEWFSGAATVLDFSFSTKSGASKNVKLAWRFGNKYQKYWLCGNNSEPPSATRIYAGW